MVRNRWLALLPALVLAASSLGCRQHSGRDLLRVDEATLAPPGSELTLDRLHRETLFETEHLQRHYDVPLPPREVARFYQSELEARGWVFAGQSAERDSIHRSWRKGALSFRIVVDNRFPDATATTLSVYLGKLAASERAAPVATPAGPRPPAELYFLVSPSRTIAGVPMPVDLRVIVKDADGNLDESDGWTGVTLGIDSGPEGAQLSCPGGLTEWADRGVVVFSSCEVDKLGEYVLRATSDRQQTALSGRIDAPPQRGELLANGESLTLTTVSPGRPVTFDFVADGLSAHRLRVQSADVFEGVVQLATSSASRPPECELLAGECSLELGVLAPGHHSVMVRGFQATGRFEASFITVAAP